MRQLCLFLIVTLATIYSEMACGAVGNKSEDIEVSSFCTEGKKWNYIYFNVEEPGKEKQPYSYEVRGDTIVGEYSYKKVYYQKDDDERLSFMLRDDEHKVYKLYPDQEEFLLFDFGRNDVGQVHSWISYWDNNWVTNWMIYAIDTIQVNDYFFRRYCCYQKYSETELDTIEDGEGIVEDYWVEGIGSARYGIEASNLEVEARLPGITEYFISCYENGNCIFTADDFKKPAYTTGIQKVERTSKQYETIYNLQGVRTDQPKKGVYIQNGKKLIVNKR